MGKGATAVVMVGVAGAALYALTGGNDAEASQQPHPATPSGGGGGQPAPPPAGQPLPEVHPAVKKSATVYNLVYQGDKSSSVVGGPMETNLANENMDHFENGVGQSMAVSRVIAGKGAKDGIYNLFKVIDTIPVPIGAWNYTYAQLMSNGQPKPAAAPGQVAYVLHLPDGTTQQLGVISADKADTNMDNFEIATAKSIAIVTVKDGKHLNGTYTLTKNGAQLWASDYNA